MSASILQAEYGAFNPRFVGISLVYDSLENFRAVRDYLMTNEVPEATDDLNRISLLSTMDHEMRHFHDFLLSPYSYRIFRLRLQAVANGTQALRSAREVGGTCLPVPIVRWMRLSPAERKELIGEWRVDLGNDAETPPLPHRTTEELLNYGPSGTTSLTGQSGDERFSLQIDGAAIAYARIQQLTAGLGAVDSALTPRNVHETSALTSQIVAIYSGQGVAQAVAFANFLLTSDLPHARAWRMLFHLALPPGSASASISVDSAAFRTALTRVQSMTLWCLLGNYEVDGEAASPVVRLGKLLEKIGRPVGEDQTGLWKERGGLSAAWDSWDRQTSVSPWWQSAVDLLSLAERGEKQYEALVAQWEGDRAVPELLLALLSDVRDQQRQSVGVLLDDPDAVGDPFRYVRIHHDALPVPPLKIEVLGHGLDIGTTERARVLTRRDPAGVDYASGIAVALSDDVQEQKRLDRALEFESVSEWCDFAFSDNRVPDHVAPSARRGLGQITGKMPLAIM